MHRRQSSPSSSSRNLATMGSPEEGEEDSSFASMRARRGSVASASASVAERKKKLASAAGASGREFDGVISSGSGGGGGSFLGSLRRKNSNAGASPNASAQSLVRSNSNSRRVPQSTSGASLASDSLEVPMPASKTESPIVGVGVGGGESTSVTSSGDSVKAAKSSLKSRLFGLRSSNGNKADSKMKKLNGSKASSRRGAAYDGSDRGDTASIASEHSGSVSQSQPEATPFFTPPLGISGGGGGSGSGSEEAIVSSSFADSIDARLSRVDSGSRLSAGLATSPGGADATARSGISALGPSSSSLAHEPTTTTSSSRSSRGAALAGLGLESASISTSRSQPLQLSVPARDEQAGESPTEAAGLERPRSRSPGGTMLRMDSWPPREKRSSSFVSIKASGEHARTD